MPLDVKDFDYICQLVREKASIVLENGKEALVESRLSILARRKGIESVKDLLSQLHSDKEGILHRQVVDAMTTNETLFFRDIYPYKILRTKILSKIIKKREGKKQLNIWSAGCSSGQEPYSIAIILKEHFPELANWSIRIIAGDVSDEMLKRAREGRYTQFEINRGLPASMLVKYFHQKGVDWQIREDIRRMVEFEPVNLAKNWPLLPSFDIIFMRNVLIYFDIPTKKTILDRIKNVLKKDGYLFLGTAETTLNLDDSFERIQYEKAWCYRPASPQ